MKKVLITIIVLVLFSILALVALVLFINPNNYKTMIERQVAAKEGYELNLGGDLSWQIWPSLGVVAQKVTLKSPEQSEPILTAKSLLLNVEILPLLSRGLVVKNAKLDDAVVNISHDTPLPKSQHVQLQSKSSDDSSNKKPWKVELRQLTINNANINLQLQSDKRVQLAQTNLVIKDTSKGNYKVDFNGAFQLAQQPVINYSLQGNVNLNQMQQVKLDVTGKIEQSQQTFSYQATTELDLTRLPNMATINFAPFTYKISSTTLPELAGSITGQVDYAANPATITADALQLLVNKQPIQLSFSAILDKKPTIELQLNATTLDFSSFITAQRSKTAHTNTTESTTSKSDSVASSQVNSLQFLTSFNGKLSANIQSLTLNDGLNLQQLQVNANNDNGVAALNLKCHLLGGNTTLQATANGNPGEGWVKLVPSFSQVELSQFKQFFPQSPLVMGTIKGSGDLVFTKVIPDNLLSTLNGDLKLQASDLKWDKVNLLQVIQSQIPTQLLQEKATEDESSASQSYTELGQADLVAHIQDGLLQLKQAQAHSTPFNLDATGWLNMVKHTVDIALDVNLLPVKKWDNTVWAKFVGQTIPLNVKGTFDKLSYQLDVSTLLQHQLKKELNKQINKLTGDSKGGDILDNSKAQQLLNNLFK